MHAAEAENVNKDVLKDQYRVDSTNDDHRRYKQIGRNLSGDVVWLLNLHDAKRLLLAGEFDLLRTI
jgi:hypothetical protein